MDRDTTQTPNRTIFLRYALHALPFVFLAGIIAAVCMTMVFGPSQGRSGAPAVQNYGPVPDFTLTDHKGAEFSGASLRGKVWVADFIFTRCGMQCPKMTREMHKLHRAFRNLQLVSFTVDPSFDTPEVLAEYTEKYQAQSDRWHFLTGEPEYVKEVIRGFHIAGAEQPVFHSLSFVLVDPSGQIRGYYQHDDAEAMRRLMTDARKLLRYRPA